MSARTKSALVASVRVGEVGYVWEVEEDYFMFLVFVLTVLANRQAVETLHHGEIFSNLRARLEARGGFLADLILCPYCLSHWTSILLSACALAYLAPISSWQILRLAPIFWLAVTAGSGILNDLGHAWWRTPKGITNSAETVDLEDIIDGRDGGSSSSV